MTPFQLTVVTTIETPPGQRLESVYRIWETSAGFSKLSQQHKHNTAIVLYKAWQDEPNYFCRIALLALVQHLGDIV